VDSPRHYFVCGIGGSGMLPLAILLKGLGHRVSGSDRSHDQGRTPEKFAWIAAQGIELYPQDGSGVLGGAGIDAVVISKAVEAAVPDIAAAKAENIPILLRAEMLIKLFNGADKRIAIAGTSGKTTTTGMTGFLLKEAGLDPSVMNGGIFRNYAADNPYSTAFVGGGGLFVTEVDESDGAAIVARYAPDIAVLHNISLDHQPMEELRSMFAGFLAKAAIAVINADDAGVEEIAGTFQGRIIRYSSHGAAGADLRAEDYVPEPDGSRCVIVTKDGERLKLSLRLPGRHNISNALAALAAAVAAGMELKEAVRILGRFEGIKRRMEIVGRSASGIIVMDDFAHNPDKVAATLTTLREFDGRLLIFFQPHGYGFLKVVGKELAESFASHLAADDRLYLVEPLYLGGSADKSIGAAYLAGQITALGGHAALMPDREAVLEALCAEAKPGDRIIVMGARDDSLSAFARTILGKFS